VALEMVGQQGAERGGISERMLMPFGKYQGCMVSDLPGPYLQWLADGNKLRGHLRTAVEQEYRRRAPEKRRALDTKPIRGRSTEEPSPRPTRQKPNDPVASMDKPSALVCEELFRAGRVALLKTYQNSESIKTRIEIAHDWLLTKLEELDSGAMNSDPTSAE
jgi:hypothetical protein